MKQTHQFDTPFVFSPLSFFFFANAVTLVQQREFGRGPTSHEMTSSCLRPFPPLTFDGATAGTVWKG